MLVKFTIDTSKIPCHDANPLFLEIVIKQNNIPLVRIPYHGDEKKKVELYGDMDEINTNRVLLSNLPSVVRYKGHDPNGITLHVNKVVVTANKKIGIITNIQEDSSNTQDVTLFTIGGSARVPPFVVDYKTFDELCPVTRVDEISIHENVLTYWMTQREFYSTCHITQHNHVHKENISLVVDFCNDNKNTKFKSLLDMLIKFGNTITKDRLEYHCDMLFDRPSMAGDGGNSSIETSVVGDCEDFGHYYMRVFRLLMSTYRYIVDDKTSPLFKLCKVLSLKYIPFFIICQVLQDNVLQFHCTMMLISRDTTKHKNISFEVTNPCLSTYLPSDEFYQVS